MEEHKHQNTPYQKKITLQDALKFTTINETNEEPKKRILHIKIFGARPKAPDKE